METGSNEKEEKGNGNSKQASKKGYTINDMGKGKISLIYIL